MDAPETVTLPDGRQLAYATYGCEDGTPFVFHHGVPGSRVLGSLFDSVACERGVRVIAPTRPGYGRSAPFGTTLETWATDCAVLADHLSLDSFTAAGFSGGGPFALAVAEQLSNRVNAVGLVGAIVPENDSGLFETLARVPPVLGTVFRATEWMVRVRGSEFVVRQLTSEAVDPSTENTVYRDFRTALERETAGVVRESQFFAGDWSLPDPSVPIHAWHGVADANVRIDPVRRAYAGQPHVTLSETDTDHLGALLLVREALVGLAATGSENEGIGERS